MKGIIHIRIDDRLIHGQVAMFWTNELSATRIMVINDAVAADPMQKSLLRMAAPSNVATSIISKDSAVTNITSGKYEGQRVFIVVKSPIEILYLVNHGIQIQSINVGNMSGREHTTSLRQNINVTAEELDAFQQLLDKGIEITTVMIPSDAKTYLTQVMK